MYNYGYSYGHQTKISYMGRGIVKGFCGAFSPQKQVSNNGYYNSNTKNTTSKATQKSIGVEKQTKRSTTQGKIIVSGSKKDFPDTTKKDQKKEPENSVNSAGSLSSANQKNSANPRNSETNSSTSKYSSVSANATNSSGSAASVAETNSTKQASHQQAKQSQEKHSTHEAKRQENHSTKYDSYKNNQTCSEKNSKQTSSAYSSSSNQYKSSSQGYQRDDYVYRNYEANSRMKEGYLGLPNIKGNCFLNALVQCLFHIDPLTEYFIGGSIKSKLKRGSLASAYRDLVFSMTDTGKYHSAEYFFKVLKGESDIYYRTYGGNDSKAVLFDILEKFQEELSAGNMEVDVSDYEDTDEEGAYRKVRMKEQANETIITKLFDYCLLEKSVCRRCHTKYYIYNYMNNLLFSMNSVKNKKYIHVDDIVKEHFRVNTEEYYCQKCKREVDVETLKIIKELSEYFIIILDREVLGTKILYDEVLDLNNFVDEKLKGKYMYKLCSAVIANDTVDSKAFHAMAICRRDEDDFYFFSDSYYKKVDVNEFDKYNPYILFYKKETYDQHEIDKKNQRKIAKENKEKNRGYNNYNSGYQYRGWGGHYY